MPNFNICILAGHLTRDPELRYTPKGSAIAKFGLAVNRNWKTETGEEKKEVTFIDVDCFGKQAEVIAKYFKKGRAILLEGRLKLDTWEKDGTKHQKLGVVLESFSFIGGGEKEGEGKPAPTTKPHPAPAEVTAVLGDLEDVPF